MDVREKLQQVSVLDMVKSRQEKGKIRVEETSLERTTKKVLLERWKGKD